LRPAPFSTADQRRLDASFAALSDAKSHGTLNVVAVRTMVESSVT
jgi:hypothetical protein